MEAAAGASDRGVSRKPAPLLLVGIISRPASAFDNATVETGKCKLFSLLTTFVLRTIFFTPHVSSWMCVENGHLRSNGDV